MAGDQPSGPVSVCGRTQRPGSDVALLRLPSSRSAGSQRKKERNCEGLKPAAQCDVGCRHVVEPYSCARTLFVPFVSSLLTSLTTAQLILRTLDGAYCHDAYHHGVIR